MAINKTSSSTKKISKQAAEATMEQGKMVAGGKKYQISIQVVEIGSKPKPKKKRKSKLILNFSIFI